MYKPGDAVVAGDDGHEVGAEIVDDDEIFGRVYTEHVNVILLVAMELIVRKA